MADNFDACLAFTLKEEGGWSDNPNDPGGCTMQGITLASYRDWKNDSTLSCEDLHVVTSEDVTAFYHDEYWDRSHAESFPFGVDLMVMDAGVNMGLGRSAKILQEQVGVAADGAIGPATVAAVLAIDPSILIDSLAKAQLEFYYSLADYAIFGQGWINRVSARHTAATAMSKIA